MGHGEHMPCKSCGKQPDTTTRTRMCARCREVWYCGETCSKKDWRLHKVDCKKWSEYHAQVEELSMSEPLASACISDYTDYLSSKAFHYDMEFAARAVFEPVAHTLKLHETHGIFLALEYDRTVQALRGRFKMGLRPSCTLRSDPDLDGAIDWVAQLGPTRIGKQDGRYATPGKTFSAPVAIDVLMKGDPESNLPPRTKLFELSFEPTLSKEMSKGWEEYFGRCHAGPPARNYEEVVSRREAELASQRR